MRRKKLLLLFLSPALLQAQYPARLLYGFAVNNNVEHVVTIDPSLKTYNARALGFYWSLGLQKQTDSVFVFQTSLRYGRERSSFEVWQNGVMARDYYYYSNRTLMLFFSPGLVINKRQKLFLTIGAGRFYQSDTGGGGVRAGRGSQRTYTYALHLNRNSWDYRLGLKWQIKPNPLKKINFEIGTEISWLEHQSLIEIDNGYNNQTPEQLQLNYTVMIFYLAVGFNKAN